VLIDREVSLVIPAVYFPIRRRYRQTAGMRPAGDEPQGLIIGLTKYGLSNHKQRRTSVRLHYRPKSEGNNSDVKNSCKWLAGARFESGWLTVDNEKPLFAVHYPLSTLH
jgi:hypothetical protein